MSKTSVNLCMVMIGLFIAMSLDMMVKNLLVGSIELGISVCLFIILNYFFGGDQKAQNEQRNTND